MKRCTLGQLYYLARYTEYRYLALLELFERLEDGKKQI
jgi:hypothetical protein